MPNEIGFKFTVDGHEASPLSLAFQGRLEEVVAAKLAFAQRAYPRAMARGVTQPGKAKLRATIEATGFYRAGSLAKTWRATTYPPGQPSLEPAAYFKSGIGVIIDAFETGATITVRGAQFLAIPEGPAKGIIHALNRGRTSAGPLRNEANPVERVAQALGTTLIPIVDEKTGRGVLVAASGATLTRTGRLAKRQAGKPTVLFALVRQATLKRRPMGREVLAQIKASFEGDFATALAAEFAGEDR